MQKVQNLVPEYKRNPPKLKRVFKRIREHDFVIICPYKARNTKDQNQQLLLELKTALIKLRYNVSTIDCIFKENFQQKHQIPFEARAFAVVDHYDKGNLKNDLMELSQKYQAESIVFFDHEKQNCYLLGTQNNAYPGWKQKIRFDISKDTDLSLYFKENNDSPFVLKNISDVFYNYNCSIVSYNLSTIMCLIHFEDFVLRG